MSDVLIVVAHPDDESLFCGAAIARRVAGGDTVRVVSLGTGVGARGGTSKALMRENEQRTLAFSAACRTLGVTDYELCCAFPDQKADTVPQIDINRVVESVLSRHPADVVYTHWIGDLNVDHRRVAEAVLVATRMGPDVVCMSPEFPERCVGPAWEPSFSEGIFPDTKGFYDTKLQACLCYQAELRPWPHPRSARGILEREEAFMEIR